MTMTMMMMMNAYLELYESVEDGLRPFTLAVVAVLLRRQAGQQRSRRRVAMSCHPGRRQRHHVDAATSRQVPPRGPCDVLSSRPPPAPSRRRRHIPAGSASRTVRCPAIPAAASATTSTPPHPGRFRLEDRPVPGRPRYAPIDFRRPEVSDSATESIRSPTTTERVD